MALGALGDLPRIQTGNDYRDRAMTDIVKAERQLRDMAEGQNRVLRSILYDLAFRLAGVTMEDQRRTDPHAPDCWKAEEWRSFFNATLLASFSGTNAWGTAADPASLQMEIDHLNDQLAKAGERIGVLENDIQARDTELANREMSLQQATRTLEVARGDLARAMEANHQLRMALAHKSREAAPGQADELAPAALPTDQALDGIPAGQPADRFEVATLSVDAGRTSVLPAPLFTATCEEARFQQMVQELIQLDTTRPVPERFKTRFDETTPLKIRRQALILYTIARYGLSTNLEIDRVVSAAEGCQMRSNSIKTPLLSLARERLLLSETFQISQPYTTSLVCLRLSEDAKSLCRAWGWEPVESDWDRIIRLQQGDRQDMSAHTLGILILAMHARFRGWTAEVLPVTAGDTLPDLLIQRDADFYYVEFECGGGEQVQKWRNIAEWSPNHQVALCTYTPEDRSQHVQDCKALQLSGVATDLQHLIFDPATAKPIPIPKIASTDPLWQETW